MGKNAPPSLLWTFEEEAGDFKRLTGEMLAEFIAARDAHLSAIEAFSPIQQPL